MRRLNCFLLIFHVYNQRLSYLPTKSFNWKKVILTNLNKITVQNFARDSFPFLVSKHFDLLDAIVARFNHNEQNYLTNKSLFLTNKQFNRKDIRNKANSLLNVIPKNVIKSVLKASFTFNSFLIIAIVICEFFKFIPFLKKNIKTNWNKYALHIRLITTTSLRITFKISNKHLNLY